MATAGDAGAQIIIPPDPDPPGGPGGEDCPECRLPCCGPDADLWLTSWKMDDLGNELRIITDVEFALPIGTYQFQNDVVMDSWGTPIAPGQTDECVSGAWAFGTIGAQTAPNMPCNGLGGGTAVPPVPATTHEYIEASWATYEDRAQATITLSKFMPAQQKFIYSISLRNTVGNLEDPEYWIAHQPFLPTGSFTYREEFNPAWNCNAPHPSTQKDIYGTDMVLAFNVAEQQWGLLHTIAEHYPELSIQGTVWILPPSASESFVRDCSGNDVLIDYLTSDPAALGEDPPTVVECLCDKLDDILLEIQGGGDYQDGDIDGHDDSDAFVSRFLFRNENGDGYNPNYLADQTDDNLTHYEDAIEEDKIDAFSNAVDLATPNDAPELSGTFTMPVLAGSPVIPPFVWSVDLSSSAFGTVRIFSHFFILFFTAWQMVVWSVAELKK
jgi:hypothetical protein